MTIALTFILTLFEVFILSGVIPECSDTTNYLSHPGVENIFSSIDGFLYFLLYIIGDNIIWFKTLQISSFIIYNIAICFSLLEFNRKILLFLAPFTLSIVGLHLWSCGIRAGLSTSIVILFISLGERNNFDFSAFNPFSPQSHSKLALLLVKFLKVLSFLLAILTHWSSVFVIAVIFVCNNFMYSLKEIRLLIMGRVKIVVFALTILLSAFLFLFLIFATAKYTILSSNDNYGAQIPYVIFYTGFVSLYFLSSIRSPSLKFRNFALVLALMSLAFLMLTGLNNNIIRVIVPLSLVSSYYMIRDLPTLRSVINFSLICSPPYLFYSIKTYFLQYSQ